MVAVKLDGRLGNQLFQYAFIYAAAKKLDTGFYLDKGTIDFIPAKYFNLKTDFLSPLDKTLFAINGFKNLFNFTLKRWFYKRLENSAFGNRLLISNNNQTASDVLNHLQNNCMYAGYFQSEKYFEHVNAELRQLLSVKKKYTSEFATLVKKLPWHKKKIVIHIRRGDYVDLNLSPSIAYYKTALTAAGFEDAYCIFISDDPQYVETEFKHIKNKYISNNSEIIDLQLLINADVCILSNSSFSWWGAWLNTGENKQLFAPKYWLGFNDKTDYPVEIGYNMNINWITA